MKETTNCPYCRVALRVTNAGTALPCEACHRLRLHRKVEPEDGAPLIALLREHNLTLPRNAIEWRTSGARGRISSLNMSVTMLCTDGVVAWFVTASGSTFFGHHANFEADKLTTAKYGGGASRARTLGNPRKKSLRQQLLESI